MFPDNGNKGIERLNFQLRATGVKPEQFSPLRSGIHNRGYLPHVKREGATYFVTFRLADSLPKQVFVKIQARRAERLVRFHALQESSQKLGATAPPAADLEQIERDYFRELENYLDRSEGECFLRRPPIAELTAGALRFFDEERYQLRAWVVMPNHVHAVVWPMPNYTLSEIVQSWKAYTGREANKLLKRSGPFWQPEPFDHWIRNDVEHARCCSYVLNNPVKAHLCAAPEDWKWCSAWNGHKK